MRLSLVATAAVTGLLFVASASAVQVPGKRELLVNALQTESKSRLIRDAQNDSFLCEALALLAGGSRNRQAMERYLADPNAAIQRIEQRLSQSRRNPDFEREVSNLLDHHSADWRSHAALRIATQLLPAKREIMTLARRDRALFAVSWGHPVILQDRNDLIVVGALDRVGDFTYLYLATDLIRARSLSRLVRVHAKGRNAKLGMVRAIWIESGELHFVIEGAHGDIRYEGEAITRIELMSPSNS